MEIYQWPTAGLAVPVDNSTPLNPINAAVKYTDVERNSGGDTRPEDRLQQNPAVAEFDNTATELPTDELILNLAAGRANP